MSDRSNRERMHTGELYLPDDGDIMREQLERLELLYEFNATRPSEPDKRGQLLKKMVSSPEPYSAPPPKRRSKRIPVRSNAPLRKAILAAPYFPKLYHLTRVVFRF